MRIEAVFFDVGEVLVDETEVWGTWADWLGVPRLTLGAALGAAVERDLPLLEMFRMVRPDREPEDLLRERARDQPDHGFSVRDLYPDAGPCLNGLRRDGLRVGIAGNQPRRAEAVLRDSGLAHDWLVISEVLGIEKPDPAFFSQLCRISGLEPERIAYVGDRVDNDVIPAAHAGMVAVHLRRGPWGVIQGDRPEAARARLRISSLDELGPGLAGLTGA
jgi:FMN phosphatase YigB (HAD superfamily)